jgi:hypothetical protein
VGLPDDLNVSRQAARETSICGHVVADNKTLVIEDTARDPHFANNPFLQEHKVRFYAGAPLRTAQGYVIGSLCVIDTRPRKLTGRDVKFLEMIADELMSDVGRRDGDAGIPSREPTLAGVRVRARNAALRLPACSSARRGQLCRRKSGPDGWPNSPPRAGAGRRKSLTLKVTQPITAGHCLETIYFPASTASHRQDTERVR